MPALEPADGRAWPVNALPPTHFLDFDPSVINDGSTATMAPSFREHPDIRMWVVRYDFDAPPVGQFEASVTYRTTPEAVGPGIGNPQLLAYLADPGSDFPPPAAGFTLGSDQLSSAWRTQVVPFSIGGITGPSIWIMFSASATADSGGNFTHHDLADLLLTVDGATIPPTRLFPRDDTAGNTPRIYPPPRSIQSGNRLDTYY